MEACIEPILPIPQSEEEGKEREIELRLKRERQRLRELEREAKRKLKAESERRKRKRNPPMKATPSQSERLMQVFAEETHPGETHMRELASELNMEFETVKRWFKYRRSKRALSRMKIDE